MVKVEEQAAELEKELVLKERDTLLVLKELEATKMMVEELKLKLQKTESDVQFNIIAEKKPLIVKEDEEEKENNPNLSVQNLSEISNPCLILMELQQAKVNLTRTTDDLAEIRASVDSYNKKIERERVFLERTHERLRSNTVKISSIEEEMKQTKSKLEEGRGISNGGDDIVAELQRLSEEAEDYKKKGEAAKSEVVKVMSEIDQMKGKLKTAEIRLVAARKMKEAAMAAEAVAFADIKALENPESIAMEEAMEEVRSSKQALEDALNRVEAANRAKLVSILSDVKAQVLKPTLSIGQILSQKLLITEEFESGRSRVKRKVSLGQMLGKQHPVISSAWKFEREFDGTKKTPVKRKKFGFGRFSVLLTKQSKKKKKPAAITRAR